MSAVCLITALAAINIAHGAVSLPLFLAGLWLSHYSEITADQIAGIIGLAGLIGILAGVIFGLGRIEVWGY